MFVPRWKCVEKHQDYCVLGFQNPGISKKEREKCFSIVKKLLDDQRIDLLPVPGKTGIYVKTENFPGAAINRIYPGFINQVKDIDLKLPVFRLNLNGNNPLFIKVEEEEDLIPDPIFAPDSEEYEWWYGNPEF